MNSLVNKGKSGLSGSTIKLVALFTMLIDHIGYALVFPIVNKNGITDAEWLVYYVFRAVGRFAFPLYIFLLIEGFQYTRSRGRYLLRLFVFSFISEIPFDRALIMTKNELTEGKLFELTYQNVFFTLLLGFAAIMMIDTILQKGKERWLFGVGTLAVSISAMLFAQVLHSDYGAVGVLAIIIAYFFRKMPVLEIIAICMILAVDDMFEAFAFLDVFIILHYNGKKGSGIKWLFYAFYPVHLFMLCAVKLCI